jgi:hypothetical protein
LVNRLRQPAALEAVLRLASQHRDWNMQMRALETLGSWQDPSFPRRPDVAQALATIARTDDYALVRQAALEAIFALRVDGYRELLEERETTDPEPRLRDRARDLLKSAP